MKNKEDNLIFYLFIVENGSWCRSTIEKHLENEKVFNIIGHISADEIFNRGFIIAKRENEAIGKNIY